ncbi:TPA: ATP-binding protein [Candidatus Poribacteria bacterium]|nr:ATP-binding protein [Candidatus Poribacteria bacterium]
MKISFKTFSKGSGSILTRDEIRTDELPLQYVQEKDGIRLVCIGKILQSLEGCACPMGALSREFLKRLRLRESEMVLIDTEAGVEHFGRGVETSVDSVLIVVEPSLDSLELAEKINTLASQVGIGEKVWAILNKIPSDELKSKLMDDLAGRNVKVIGTIEYDPDIFLASLEGRPPDGDKPKREMKRILDALLEDEGREDR